MLSPLVILSKEWIPFLLDSSHHNVRHALEERVIGSNQTQPLYLVVDTYEFRSYLIEQLVPDYSAGYSAVAVNRLFRNFFLKFNEHNIYFIFYFRRSRFFPPQAQIVNQPQKLPTPFNQDILLLWNALDVNNPNDEHGNKVKFIPSGSLTHHIAEEVRQNDSYYAFSSKVHLFFHQRCKVAFFRGDFGLKEFYDQLYDGKTGQMFLFHQDRFLPFEKMVALLASTSNTVQKYEEVLNFFNSDDNCNLWTVFLANNPHAATVVFSTLNNYKISTDLVFPTTYSDSSSVARIQYEKVQPLDKFEEPDLELDLEYFDSLHVPRHYSVILKYATPAIQFLRSNHSLGGCQGSVPISEKFLDSLDNVLAPEHRQLLLEGSRSSVEMLLSIIESFSNHSYGNEWSTPDIHSSWIHLFEEVCEVENTVFCCFLSFVT
ncbi:hypothetical protein GEMRC1_004101 [Eukaryota sp. GEM-RC1]